MVQQRTIVYVKLLIGSKRGVEVSAERFEELFRWRESVGRAIGSVVSAGVLIQGEVNLDHISGVAAVVVVLRGCGRAHCGCW